MRNVCRRASRSSKIWSLPVVVLQRTATKRTKIYNARAQPLFFSLRLLFGDVLFAVAVVVCLRPGSNSYEPNRMQMRKIGTHCVYVSTAMLTKCVGEGMGELIRNNQVQVAEVLPLYAKGTGQQGVC